MTEIILNDLMDSRRVTIAKIDKEFTPETAKRIVNRFMPAIAKELLIGEGIVDFMDSETGEITIQYKVCGMFSGNWNITRLS